MAQLRVVDDDRQPLEVLATALAYEGHQVRTANDGLEGLDAVRAEAPLIELTRRPVAQTGNIAVREATLPVSKSKAPMP